MFNTAAVMFTVKSVTNKMEFLRPENIFTSFKFCLFFNKLGGYSFFTVKTDASGNFSMTTTVLNVLLLLGGLLFELYLFLEFFVSSLSIASPSMIMDLGIFILNKFKLSRNIIIMSTNFCYRRKWFQIFSEFHWIDKKVRLSTFFYYLIIQTDQSFS